MPQIPMVEVPLPTPEEVGINKFIPAPVKVDEELSNFLAGIYMAVETTVKGASDNFSKFMLVRQAIAELFDEGGYLSNLLRRCNDVIGTALDQVGQKGVVWGKFRVERRKGSAPRRTLDATLLLNAGVLPQQLEGGYKVGKPGKPSLVVTKIKDQPNNH